MRSSRPKRRLLRQFVGLVGRMRNPVSFEAGFLVLSTQRFRWSEEKAERKRKSGDRKAISLKVNLIGCQKGLYCEKVHYEEKENP